MSIAQGKIYFSLYCYASLKIHRAICKEGDLCITLFIRIRQGKNRRIAKFTGVNEHIEPVFNVVLSNAAVILRS